MGIAGNDMQPAWLFSVIEKVPKLFKDFLGRVPKTQAVARDFETAFDQALIGQSIENIGRVALDYKQALAASQEVEN